MRINGCVCRGPVAKQLENTGLNYFFFFFSWRSKDISILKNRRSKSSVLIAKKFYAIRAEHYVLYSYVFLFSFLNF